MCDGNIAFNTEDEFTQRVWKEVSWGTAKWQTKSWNEQQQNREFMDTLYFHFFLAQSRTKLAIKDHAVSSIKSLGNETAALWNLQWNPDLRFLCGAMNLNIKMRKLFFSQSLWLGNTEWVKNLNVRNMKCGFHCILFRIILYFISRLMKLKAPDTETWCNNNETDIIIISCCFHFWSIGHPR
jgi:hypothetical protein